MILSETDLRDRLAEPTGKVNMVLDTDTFNEIDDQFALTLAVLSPDKINLRAVTAAPFLNARSSDAGDGMLKSYDEILRVLERLNASKDDFVFKGSDSFLPNRTTPIESEAAETIIELAHKSATPLYVTAIGAITNVASAILLDPTIIPKIVVVWLGGQPFYWNTAREFNLQQDIVAGQVIFDSGVPLIMVPCKNVAEQLRTTVWELEKYVKGRGAVGDFLFERFCGYSKNHFGWTKEIWDMAPIAWLINPEWVPSILTPTPVLTDDAKWAVVPGRQLCRVAMDVHRDSVFRDFFTKLDHFSR
ncbi:MAG: nucleoside hydrolase [Victivallaceae bacterium]|nr:nucleoside hydrolase [Victivallaceae bacterium]